MKNQQLQGVFGCPFLILSHSISSSTIKIYPNFYPISKFLHPPIHITIPLFPLHFHHFSPLLSIHLLHCGKCGKLCGKLVIFAYKYPKIIINNRKIPINTPKSYQDTPFVFFISCFLDILIVVSLIYWEPMVPTPSFPEKTFSLFSSSPHFVRVAVKPFFIYRT